VKVKDLVIGMILVPSDDDRLFVATKHNQQSEAWVMSSLKRNFKHIQSSPWYCDHSNFLVYLGTKKDVDIAMQWCNRFALLNNRIVGVDPTSWRWIEPMKDDCGDK